MALAGVIMLKAVLFDFDGLILDTEGADYAAWQEVYEAHGQSVPLETWAPLIGSVGHGFDPCAHLESLVGRPLDQARIRTECRARNLARVAALDPLPGVLDVMEAARRRGLKLGLASSSSRAWVLPHLERLGIDVGFDVVCCSDDVRHIKPHPELYLSALEALGVSAEEAIALEDSRTGMRAAQAAGIFCVVVPTALTRHLTVDEADLLLASLEHLRLEDVMDVSQ